MGTWLEHECWGVRIIVLASLFLLTALSKGKPVYAAQDPLFLHNVSVHDPSVIKVDDTYYVFGSHLAAAKSTDLIQWNLVASGVRTGNKLIPNVLEEMGDELAWVESDTFWAPDVIQLPDGRFYMYYCIGRLDAPRALTGLAVSDSIEGPYTNLGPIVRSGMWGQRSPDGRIYDPTIHPNTVDPHVFFDADGDLWMVYGSYSGGIFILEMDPETGLPQPNQGYGQTLLGGNHSRIEGPYILYSPHSEYYYLFVTFGGLAADGGYNIRVMRSKYPDGPYFDGAGNPMISTAGRQGTLFDDRSIEPYGVKLMGNYRFLAEEGEPRTISRGYVSPGHNSAYYDPESGKYFLFFHTRFVNRGEHHEVRVHQMFINDDGWFVVAPHRYAGETIEIYPFIELVGEYKFINHGKSITNEVQESVLVSLNEDGSITGSITGQWKQIGGSKLEIFLGDEIYKGVFLRQWDDDQRQWVMTFSALSHNGVAIWGSRVAE